jgi:NAD(P)-dependent dehydrogenase (short-subunit alcohol dehydrogenase family)
MAEPGNTPSLLQRLRGAFVRAPRAERVDLVGRRIVVTGAAPGSIGFETARTLATWGASVIVTTRANPGALAGALNAELPASTAGAAIEARALDLSRADSVARFAEWYEYEHGDRLDVLVNNAGIHLDLLSQWKQQHLTEDGYEIHWRTNYLGTMDLTYRLLPLLQNAGQATGDARVVNVVSQLHTKGSNSGLFQPPQPYNSWVAYGLSKLALVHATFEMQRRFADRYHLQAYCLHPGAVFTNIAGKGLAGNRLVETVRNALAPIEAFFLMTPEEGAQTQIHCATRAGLRGGLYYRDCQPATPSVDSGDAQTSARLWNETEAWVKTLG